MGRVGDTITLSEASRFGRSTAFSLMLKPVGSRCNLHCSYCYYLDKSFLYGGSEPLMSLPLLERCIRDFCASCDLPELTVEWHGGEPLLAGMDFFRNALAFEKNTPAAARCTTPSRPTVRCSMRTGPHFPGQ